MDGMARGCGGSGDSGGGSGCCGCFGSGGELPAAAVKIVAGVSYDKKFPKPTGCRKLGNGAEIKGAFVVVERGECGFGDKAMFAQIQGAAGVIIMNTDARHDADMQQLMAPPDLANAVTIPVLLVTSVDGQWLREAVAAYGRALPAKMKRVKKFRKY